jgi:hypothetical protein
MPEVAERCLNHTEDNKVKRVYQRHIMALKRKRLGVCWYLMHESCFISV